MDEPECNCMQLTGACDEKCQRIVWVRRPDYEPDLTIPVFLVRLRVAPVGVFD